MSLVVHELVENAIRYATNDEDRVEIDLRGTPDAFEIAVSNRSSREHSSHLFTVIHELERCDPKRRVLARDAPLVADCGLEGRRARLRARRLQGQVQLSADFSEGRMRVIARGAP